MVASKIDAANKDKLAKLKRYCKKQGLELFPISAVTGKGIEELKYAIAEEVKEPSRKGNRGNPDCSGRARERKLREDDNKKRGGLVRPPLCSD